MIDRLRNTRAVFGPSWALRSLVTMIALRLGKPGCALAARTFPDVSVERKAFDARYGISTDGIDDEIVDAFPGELGTLGRGYEGANHDHILAVVESVPDTGPNTEFWDLGSGKGKAVFSAALSGRFARLVGVELAESLVEAAKENTDKIEPQIPGNPEFVWRVESATEVELPTDAPLVIMVWNPFTGEVFDRVCDRISKAGTVSSHPLYVVYVFPACEDQLADRTDWVEVDRRHLHPEWFDWITYRVGS